MAEVFRLKDAAKYTTGDLDHQNDAWDTLQSTLTAKQLDKFKFDFRSTSRPSVKFPLDVPYYYQRDSATWHGDRMCQSSAIAMRIKQIDPSLIKDDDDYLEIVLKYGDTVSQAAHCKALEELGLKATFSTSGSKDKICKLLDSGAAVPIGILHKGPVSSPSGGGHWITLIGYDSSHFYVHDPYGELDLINGGYPVSGRNAGKCQKYTINNLLKRWLIQSDSDGWYWEISR